MRAAPTSFSRLQESSHLHDSSHRVRQLWPKMLSKPCASCPDSSKGLGKAASAEFTEAQASTWTAKAAEPSSGLVILLSPDLLHWVLVTARIGSRNA